MPKGSLDLCHGSQGYERCESYEGFSPEESNEKLSIQSLPKGQKISPKSQERSFEKNNLDKLGKLTLAEKVAKAAEGAETAEEAAQELKGMLTKQEHSRVWSKYNCHLKGQPKKEQKEFEKQTRVQRECWLHCIW